MGYCFFGFGALFEKLAGAHVSTVTGQVKYYYNFLSLLYLNDWVRLVLIYILINLYVLEYRHLHYVLVSYSIRLYIFRLWGGPMYVHTLGCRWRSPCRSRCGIWDPSGSVSYQSWSASHCAWNVKWSALKWHIFCKITFFVINVHISVKFSPKITHTQKIRAVCEVHIFSTI